MQQTFDNVLKQKMKKMCVLLDKVVTPCFSPSSSFWCLMSTTLVLCLLCLSQNSPGEALTKDELQTGVDAANGIAAGYQKSKQQSLLGLG